MGSLFIGKTDKRCIPAVCAGVLFVVGSQAGAGMLDVTLWANGTLVYNTSETGTATPGGFNFNGSASGTGWALDFNIDGNPDPFITSNTSVTNMASTTTTFALMVTLPVAPAITTTTLIGGSVQGGVTADGDGGTLSSVLGTSIYQAMVDGLVLGEPAALLDHPSAVVVGAFLSGSFASDAFGGVPVIPSAPGPSIASSIGILLTFDLTPGDQATFSSVFVANPIPVPATGAIFGLAGLTIARRRRR